MIGGGRKMTRGRLSVQQRFRCRTHVRLAVLLLASFTMLMNETILVVALPTVLTDLNLPVHIGQWLTTSYLLTMAIVIPTTGFVLTRWPATTVYMSAAVSFAIGTSLAAWSPTYIVLIAGRIFQAGGTALILPLVMNTVLTVVPPERRGRIMGVVAMVNSAAPVLGPTLSGLVLNQLGWRSLFWLMLPVAVFLIMMGRWALNTDGSLKSSTKKNSIDPPSVISSTLAFGGLIFGLTYISASQKLGFLTVIFTFTLSTSSLLFFIRRQRRLQKQDFALLDLRPFRALEFRIGAALLSISTMVLFCALILLPLYLQKIHGLNTTEIGVVLLPGGVVMGSLALVVGRAFDKLGAAPLVIMGSIALSISLFAMSQLEHDTDVSTIILIHTTLMAGLTLLTTPIFASALGSLPGTLHPYGIAILNVVQQLSGAAGTAIFVFVSTVNSEQNNEYGVDLIGVRKAFMVAGFLSLIALILTPFFRSSSYRGEFDQPADSR